MTTSCRGLGIHKMALTGGHCQANNWMFKLTAKNLWMFVLSEKKCDNKNRKKKSMLLYIDVNSCCNGETGN